MVIFLKLDEFFEKRLLMKDKPNLDIARKSLRQAEFFLKEAEDLINLGKKEIAVISLYNAYFHIARAFLFKDGIKERSHYALARYIEERYMKKKLIDSKFIIAMDAVRDLRHDVQYSVGRIDIEEDLSEFYNICEEFLNSAEKIIK